MKTAFEQTKEALAFFFIHHAGGVEIVWKNGS
jgi:hypothetical protein